MNSKQRIVLALVAVAIAAMLIYPPYQQQIGGQSSTATISGYSFIINMPTRSTINAATLLVQWLGVLIVGGIAFAMTKD